ncbi:prolyl oligopeptidase-like protein [Amylocarpus encephaloides]|uniref:Prolyl oligopeptidase-like protein n=1 Tax=Amylocarpus encephaloides TaxID=45428 RepID=A0A9P8CBD1_9HELO|nr:prolyl oligopeptidase-like protein [Amylocarpus encephaloides]
MEIQASPVYLPAISLFQRIRFMIRVRLLKFITTQYIKVTNLPGIKDPSTRPTYTKNYSTQPRLETRIFVPKSYKSGDALLPLYLDIHGGGFAFMNPKADDRFCSYFSNKNKILVVSLDYPKTPECQFPQPSLALENLVDEVLKDESLPFDPKKIVIGGFSAGGNLALSVSQCDGLQGKFAALVAYYPPVDFSTPIEVSLAERPKTAPPDILEKSAAMFNWAYIKPNQDLKDPLLSPAYASRRMLPPKLCIIGCEFDLLCHNSSIMAEKFSKDGNDSERKGSDIGWEKNGVKWEKILGEVHAFDVLPSKGAEKKRRAKRRDEMHESVAEWLFREVF